MKLSGCGVDGDGRGGVLLRRRGEGRGEEVQPGLQRRAGGAGSENSRDWTFPPIVRPAPLSLPPALGRRLRRQRRSKHSANLLAGRRGDVGMWGRQELVTELKSMERGMRGGGLGHGRRGFNFGSHSRLPPPLPPLCASMSRSARPPISPSNSTAAEPSFSPAERGGCLLGRSPNGWRRRLRGENRRACEGGVWKLREKHILHDWSVVGAVRGGTV